MNKNEILRNLIIGACILILVGSTIYFGISTRQERQNADQQVSVAETSEARAQAESTKAADQVNAAATANSEANQKFSAAQTSEAHAQALNTAVENRAHATATARAVLEMQANRAKSMDLLTKSQALNLEDVTQLTQSGLLAIEAANYDPGLEADQALRQYIRLTAVKRMAHAAYVNFVTYSPDGTSILSTGDDKTMRVWDVKSGHEMLRLKEVIHADFSPDGKYIVSTSFDNVVRVSDSQTGREVARMVHENVDGSLDFVLSVAFSPNSKYVASGGAGVVKVWEAQTGHVVTTLTVKSHFPGVEFIAFSPNGKYIAHANVIEGIKVVELQTGDEVASSYHFDSFAAFSPDSKYIISDGTDGTSASRNTIWVWEAQTGHDVAHMVHSYGVDAIALSRDGQYIVSSGSDITVRVWETRTGREMTTIQAESIESLAFSPNGKYIVAGGGAGAVWVWEAQTGREVMHGTHVETDASSNYMVRSVVFSLDNKYVVSGSLDSTIRVWDVQSGRETGLFPTGTDAMGIKRHDNAINAAAAGNKTYLISGSNDKSVLVWNLWTGFEIAHILHDDVVTSVAFLSDEYVVSGSRDQTVRIWDVSKIFDVSNGREVTRMQHDGAVNAVAVSKDKNYIVSGSDDKTIRVWDAKTGREVIRMNDSASVSSVAFSNTGRYIASGNSDGYVRIWDAKTGQEGIKTIRDKSITSVAFSPDDKYIAYADADHIVRVRDAQTGHQIVRLRHDGIVRSIKFFDSKTSNGYYLASGGDDHIVRVWEIPGGREVARMVHEDVVTSVDFTESFIISSSKDKSVRIWYWGINSLIAEACRHLPRNFTHAEWTHYFPDEPYRATCPDLPLESETTP